MREKILYVLALAGGLWLIRNLYIITLVLPDEAAQGAIYRNLFFHVPAWATCFTAYTVAGAASVTIAEVEEIVPIGGIDPDAVHVPSIYVQRLVLGTGYRKPIERRTVRQRS